MGEFEPNEPEITSTEIASACREVLGELADELEYLDIEEAIGLAFTLLIENGEDPEDFLKKKGLLV